MTKDQATILIKNWRFIQAVAGGLTVEKCFINIKNPNPQWHLADEVEDFGDCRYKFRLKPKPMLLYGNIKTGRNPPGILYATAQEAKDQFRLFNDADRCAVPFREVIE